MIRITKLLFITIALLLTTSVCMPNLASAQIFSGSVNTEDPESVGYCLRYPVECPDADYGTVCENPLYQDSDIRCLSEAEIGVGLAEDSLLGTGITHTQDAGDLVIKYINFILPYLALAAFVGFVVAGFFYVTAYGNEEQLQKAKKILIWSAVGLVLVIGAYTIVQLLTQDLLGGLQPTGVTQ